MKQRSYEPSVETRALASEVSKLLPEKEREKLVDLLARVSVEVMVHTQSGVLDRLRWEWSDTLRVMLSK